MPADIAAIGTLASGNGASISTNAPAGVTAGELLKLAVGVSLAHTITTPSGWTPRIYIADSFSGTRLGVYERIADGTGDDTPTVSLGGARDYAARILRIAGQAASSAFDTASSSTQTTGDTATMPSIESTAEDGELVLQFLVTDGATIDSAPAGYSTQFNDAPTGLCLACWSLVSGAAGTYGGETITLGGSDQASKAIVAYKAAAVAGANIPAVMHHRRLMGAA